MCCKKQKMMKSEISTFPRVSSTKPALAKGFGKTAATPTITVCCCCRLASVTCRQWHCFMLLQGNDLNRHMVLCLW